MIHLALYASILVKQDSSKSLHYKLGMNALTEPVTHVMQQSLFCAISWVNGGWRQKCWCDSCLLLFLPQELPARARLQDLLHHSYYARQPVFSEAAKQASDFYSFHLQMVLFCQWVCYLISVLVSTHLTACISAEAGSPAEVAKIPMWTSECSICCYLT